jgi:hypothetical protein
MAYRSFGGSGRLRHPPRYAAFFRPSSPSLRHSSAKIVQLFVERIDVREEALEVWIRTEGLASLVVELRQDERRAA